MTFDQEIDATTYSENSFLLSCAPEAASVVASGLVGSVAPVTGTDYVAGTFSFALNSSGHTIATFKPARPMRPNVKYSILISTDVATAAGVALANNYNWSFVTGVLNLTVPPIQQPGPSQVGRIRKEDITVSPRSTLNNDLHVINITFPDDIDPNSFGAEDIHVDLLTR